jgi:serine/threonine-protein kinase
LAKLTGHGERPALVGDATALTQTAPITERGTILGTLQYMAPEQLEGREADARTDLWALGAILHEMVTGRRAFAGDSQVSLIGNIMNAEPAGLATLQPLTPLALERVVKKCLAKHPDDRWDTAHDVADELRWIAQTSGASSPATTGVQPRRRRAPRMALLVAGVLAGAMIGAGVMWLLRPIQARSTVVRSTLEVLPAEVLNAGGVGLTDIPTPGGSRTALTWTPDGQVLVFVGRRGGVQQLYVRRLDADEARPLAGTEGAQVPAVSPDGQWVAFWAARVIRKVPLGGGPVTEMASGIATPPRGMAWDARGRVLFGGDDGRIWQVPAEGKPSPVTTSGPADPSHCLPWPLPGGRTLLYTVRNRSTTWGDEQIVAQSLDSGTRKVLLNDAVDARYVLTGHLVFLRRGQLWAVPFDTERVEVTGKPAVVLDAVAQALAGGRGSDITGAGQFALASTGTLAWLPGPVAPVRESGLATVDRSGHVSPLPAPLRDYNADVRLSPDGRRLAVTIQTLTELGLWLYDLGRGALTPLARGGEVFSPRWSPDGQRLVFDWFKDGQWSLAEQPADGTAPPRVLTPDYGSPSSFAPDGRQLAVVDDGDVLIVTLVVPATRAQALFQTPQHESSPEISPDGRWLAYVSDVSGRREVYVQPYPGTGPSQQVSIDGGLSPAWHPSGKELFFVSLPDMSLPDPAVQQKMLAVEFGAGSPVALGRPRLLFPFDPRVLGFSCTPLRCYDVAPDGQRFYVVQSRTSLSPPVVTHISLIQNWFEELKAKVPATGQAK